MEDLLHSFLCIADDESSIRAAEGLEVGAANRGPSALLADLSEHPLVAGKVIITRFLGRGGKGAERMDADLERFRAVARGLARLPVEINERPEA